MYHEIIYAAWIIVGGMLFIEGRSPIYATNYLSLIGYLIALTATIVGVL